MPWKFDIEDQEALPKEIEEYFDQQRQMFTEQQNTFAALLYLRHRLFEYRALKSGWLSENQIRWLFGYKSTKPIRRSVEIVESLLEKKDLEILLSQDDLVDRDRDAESF